MAGIKRISLTGCWGASLRILKTCATFPLARRCILKLGMAHRVAKLIILEQWERERKNYWNVQIKYLSVLCLKLWIMRENVAQSTSKSVSPFVIAICDMMFWISTLLLFLLFTLNILQVSRLEKLLTKKKQAGLPAALSKVKVVSFEWIPFSQQNA